MSAAERRSALVALDGARPVIARLDENRDAEDLAADLIEGWSAVETALRSLVGGAAAGGQALIREARQRQLLTFEQANSLAEFHAAAERAHRTDYRPTSADVAAARDGFLKLETSLLSAEPAPAGRAATAVEPEIVTVEPAPVPVKSERRGLGIPVWAVIALAVVVLGGLAAGGWYFFAGGQNDAYVRGVQYYQRGQREAAAGEFNKAVRDDPNDPMPHVYLSRMAREMGNYPVALQEAQKAVELGQDNVAALREMGSYLMTVGNYDLARRFYVRAVSADTTDRASQGWLGCSLVKMGRIDDGMRWINRAGSGQWQSCVAGGAMVPGPGYPAQPLPTGPGQGYPPRP